MDLVTELTCYKTLIQLLEIKGNLIQLWKGGLDVFQHDSLVFLREEEIG